jgi:hypothetical protein
MVPSSTAAAAAELGSGGSRTRAPPPDATPTRKAGTAARGANAAPAVTRSQLAEAAASTPPFYGYPDLASVLPKPISVCPCLRRRESGAEWRKKGLERAAPATLVVGGGSGLTSHWCGGQLMLTDEEAAKTRKFWGYLGEISGLILEIQLSLDVIMGASHLLFCN